jgi:uncharacterized protein (UPF0548 family)
LRYDIFPPTRLRSRVCTPDGIVSIGATIVQRVRLGPVTLETAVRVIEHQRSAESGRFAYATLDGHPEQGIASFEVETGRCVPSLHRPGLVPPR